MRERSLGFGVLASLLWSCVSAEDACPSCRETRAGENGVAPYVAPIAPRAGFCGDGIWDPASEECDDGSRCRDGRDCTSDRLRCESTSESACQPRGSDGCSEQCTIEPGFTCNDGRDCSLVPSSEEAPAPVLSAPLPDSEAVNAPDAPVGSPATAPRPPGPERCRHPDFQEPELVTGFDTDLDLWAPSLSSDGRTLFCAANTQTTPERIFFATRQERASEFSPLILLANLNSGFGDGSPLLSQNGLTFYFYSRRPGGRGDRDLWFASRGAPGAAFGEPLPLANLNGAGLDHLPWVSADERTLFYVSTRLGGSGQADLLLARRASREQGFSEPEPVTALNTGAEEGRAVLSGDGKLVIFASAREGGQGGLDLWFATREGGKNDDDGLGELSAPANLAVLNSPGLDVDPFLSADERELFFSSNRAGRAQIFRSRIECED